jgi:hypothetical protein
MEEIGWRYERTEVTDDLLVVDSEFGLVSAAEACDSINVAWAPVVCPWAPNEDELQLTAVVERLRADAIANALRCEESLAARKTPPAAPPAWEAGPVSSPSPEPSVPAGPPPAGRQLRSPERVSLRSIR